MATYLIPDKRERPASRSNHAIQHLRASKDEPHTKPLPLSSILAVSWPPQPVVVRETCNRASCMILHTLTLSKLAGVPDVPTPRRPLLQGGLAPLEQLQRKGPRNDGSPPLRCRFPGHIFHPPASRSLVLTNKRCVCKRPNLDRVRHFCDSTASERVNARIPALPGAQTPWPRLLILQASSSRSGRAAGALTPVSTAHRRQDQR